MARQMYRCWRCGGSHYVGSARGRRCAPVIPVLVAGVVLVSALAFIGPARFLKPSGSDSKPGSSSAARVVRVVDGDTFTIRGKHSGRSDDQRVRILGIDTPEVAREGRPGDCYANKATAVLERLLAVGARVELISDPTQSNMDVYGRLLRYVEVDGTDVGADLLRRGAARTRDDDPPVQRHDDYLKLEDDARSRPRGLWRACN